MWRRVCSDPRWSCTTDMVRRIFAYIHGVNSRHDPQYVSGTEVCAQGRRGPVFGPPTVRSFSAKPGCRRAGGRSDRVRSEPILLATPDAVLSAVFEGGPTSGHPAAPGCAGLPPDPAGPCDVVRASPQPAPPARATSSGPVRPTAPRRPVRLALMQRTRTKAHEQGRQEPLTSIAGSGAQGPGHTKPAWPSNR